MSGECHDHCHPVSSSVHQTLDELDFERGIWYAAQNGDLKRVEKLLDQGCHPDKVDSAGYTALHYASRSGYIDICQKLVKDGANVNATTRAGQATPLHRAAYTGQNKIVEFLLSKGADAKKIDNDGKTALHKAVEQDHYDATKILLEFCEDLKHTKDAKDKRAVDYARSKELIILLSD